MSRLVIALLKDETEEVEGFYELDTTWINEFNESFSKTNIPYKEKIYNTELIDMMSKSIIDEMVADQDDKPFKADLSPLKTILQNLLNINI